MKRDIYNIDWAEIRGPLDTAELKANYSWVLPQLSALFARLPLARNDLDKYSVSLSLKRIAKELDAVTFSNGMPLSKEAINSMLKFVLRGNRSDILSGTQLANPRYSAAVPFVLSAFKESRNISYSSWDVTDPFLQFFLEDDWVSALNYGSVPRFTTEDLLDFRAKARTFRTGSKAGTMRTINATTNITRMGIPEFDELPKYWKLALCQTWVFHPTNRHHLAITNPYNLDTPADPLVSGEIFSGNPVRQPVDWSKMWDET